MTIITIISGAGVVLPSALVVYAIVHAYRLAFKWTGWQRRMLIEDRIRKDGRFVLACASVATASAIVLVWSLS